MKNIPTMKNKKTYLSLVAIASSLMLSACSLPLNVGDKSAKTEVTGSAGGAQANNENAQLPKCTETLGTMAVSEDQGEPWFLQFTRDTRLTSTVPLIRLMAQQSNCFVIVERGAAGLAAMQRERNFAKGGELRGNSNMGGGQVVAADYTLIPSITFSQNTGGGVAGVASHFGGGIGLIGGLFGGLSKKEASVTLSLVANRSGVQLAAAEGSASKFDFGGLGGLFGSSAGGVFGAYTNTPEKKILTGAFLDAYSQIVEAVRNYKAQNVKGGLGTGGRLKVQGEK